MNYTKTDVRTDYAKKSRFFNDTLNNTFITRDDVLRPEIIKDNMEKAISTLKQTTYRGKSFERSFNFSRYDFQNSMHSTSVEKVSKEP